MAYNIAGIRQKDDLLSFVIEELYKCDQIRLREIIEDKQMTFFVARIMVNQYHSKTSRYYYKYRKYYEYHLSGINESTHADTSVSNKKQKLEVEEKLMWIEEKLKDLYWFDAEVFKTKINKNTLWKAINNVKNYLINEQ